MNETNVNYGCGLSVAPNWHNFDASPTLRLSKLPIIGRLASTRTAFPSCVKYGDVTKGLPLGKDTVDRIYCSHVLEHLCYEDCLTALTETYRVLKPGGIFRGVMPDLRAEVEAYLGDTSETAAHTFMRQTGLGVDRRKKGAGSLIVSSFGNSQHLWLWDWPSINDALKSAGFKDIRRAAFGDHEDKLFAEVEEQSRWTNCLGFTCLK